VVDRGLATAKSVQYLKDHNQSFLVGTPKGMLQEFDAHLCTQDWAVVRQQVQVKVVQRDGQAYVLARSRLRRKKERTMRRRQLHGLRDDLRKLSNRVASGKLKDQAKVQQAIGRFAERWPAAWRFVCASSTAASKDHTGAVGWTWDKSKLKAAMARDGAYLLLSDQTSWTPEQLWSTCIQLTRAEDAFRTLKSQELLRPIWHQLGNRVKAHVFVCVLAYLLWRALEHMLRKTDLLTRIRKPDERRGDASPQDRPLSVAMALKRMHDIQIGDILLETVDGRNLLLRRIARPNPAQAELLAAMNLDLPERLMSDVQSQPSLAPATTHAQSRGGEM
jgi:transposase